MPTQCSAEAPSFAPVAGRAVVAGFDGGAITSDAGALLLGATDRAIRLVERFAACFQDGRDAVRTEHSVATLVGQRVFGLALGYEDLVDHDSLELTSFLRFRPASFRPGAPIAFTRADPQLDVAHFSGAGRPAVPSPTHHYLGRLTRCSAQELSQHRRISG